MRNLITPPELGLMDGRYLLHEQLGRGAIGRVYRATNVRLGRMVAIKLLRSEHASEPDAVARFLREARAAHRVRHPNVVDVLDVGMSEAGVPYMVQELLRGEDLAAHVRRAGGALPVTETLEWMIPVARAVAHAHGHGIVHRDLKPENVFLACDDDERIVPKVVDFGISKVLDHRFGEPITKGGFPIGTPLFMAPEQIQSPPDVDVRCDVWALGVMLYRLVSGVSPFKSTTVTGLLVEICTADVTPLHTHRGELSASFVEIVRRCLERDRALRFPDGRELAAALEACGAELGVVVPQPRADDTGRVRRRTDPSGRVILPGGGELVVEEPEARSAGSSGAATSASQPTIPRPAARRWPLALALALVIGTGVLAVVGAAGAIASTDADPRIERTR